MDEFNKPIFLPRFGDRLIIHQFFQLKVLRRDLSFAETHQRKASFKCYGIGIILQFINIPYIAVLLRILYLFMISRVMLASMRRRRQELDVAIGVYGNAPISVTL